MPELLTLFGRFHLVFLHLPIGIFLALGIFEWNAWRKKGGVAPPLWVTLATASAVVAAGSGWLLHEEPGYGEDWVMEWHERLGIGIALGSLLCLWFYRQGNIATYRRTLCILTIAIIPAGHFGGMMTHGKDFLWEPLQKPEGVSADATYVSHIAPLLKSRCVKCHGARKQKGELRLDTPEWILAGGEYGPALEEEAPLESELLYRIHLPLEDEDHMPPEEKRQLKPSEVELLEAWLRAGASFENSFAWTGHEEEVNDAVIHETVDTSTLDLSPFKEALVHVQPIAANTNDLWVDFSAPCADMDDAQVQALLRPVLEHIVELNLARTKITDHLAPLFQEMPQLEKLDLRETAITDMGLRNLTQHPKLHTLNLASTSVTDTGISQLNAIPSLQKVWLWNTLCTAEGLASLQEKSPHTQFFMGYN